MPGILPMKVIKVGNSAQSRVAQACDRCRSKKIRCDGIRPCCSQCANVGFECRTSDKLSRRAFPRGYTESLEERVRALEAD
ncbi:DNA-binding transcription factor cat8, partial [Ophidiomyces ophidiicola]